MKYVGLLRGINVGGHGKLPMKSLVEICDKLGFKDTQHYIQSGNIVFNSSSEPDPDQLCKAIDSLHGFSPKVMLVPASKFAAIADENPFANDIDAENHKFLQQYMFTQIPSQVDFAKIEGKAVAGEQWKIRENCFDLYSPAGVHNSKLGRDIEKILGVPTTARNWKTISKLWEMCRHETKGGDGVA